MQKRPLTSAVVTPQRTIACCSGACWAPLQLGSEAGCPGIFPSVHSDILTSSARTPLTSRTCLPFSIHSKRSQLKGGALYTISMLYHRFFISLRTGASFKNMIGLFHRPLQAPYSTRSRHNAIFTACKPRFEARIITTCNTCEKERLFT